MDRKTSNEIISSLEKEYPIAECTLNYEDAYHLLVSVRLAAQCTDVRVNMVTPALFEKYPSPYEMAEAEVEDVEHFIKSCGFYHSKARDIVETAKILVNKFNGVIPDNMEDLLSLPGVGRKSANLILGDVFNKPGAIVVDTHCIRLTNRLGYVSVKDPVKIESALREIIPPDKSNNFCHRLVLHGRAVCNARKPLCTECCLSSLCKYNLETNYNIHAAMF